MMAGDLHVLVVRAGLHTTVQDEGRVGYQHLGVPVGGVLDRDASRRANVLVGNAPDAAVLEVTLSGCALRPSHDVVMSVTGARFELEVRPGADAGRSGNAGPAPMDTAVYVPAGSLLDLTRRLSGARAYVAIRGGVATPPLLGSRSAWPLLPRRGALQDGDVVPIGDQTIGPPRASTMAGLAYRDVLRVVPGPEARGREDAIAALCGSGYRIAASASRMAYPLDDGAAVPLVSPARPSAGTVTGAIQILPSGLPILLMAERQTTGGYPVAAAVATVDLPHAAQLPPGARVRFTPCSRADALQDLMRWEAMWRR